MDILKRIDLAQQFCHQYADGAWSIETEKWNHHVTPELIEDVRQYIESLQLQLMYLQTQQAKREVYKSESYDMIDRYLRNNLHDDDYASYSASLDEVAAAPQAVPAGFVMVPVEPTPEMVLAGRELFGGFVEDTGGDYTRIHKAMLAAAPKGAV